NEIERAIEKTAWGDLRKLLSAEDHGRLRVQLAVEWGAPAVEILRYASAHNVDLIAMGRHGNGSKSLLMGSVAETVMRKASCSVLSFRQPAIEKEPAH
ncbi:MAG: universal stress protein, partial [Acidobacteria bacterium]